MKIDAALPAWSDRPVDAPPEVDKTFGLGAIIKQVRERRGLTQKQLADQVGMERTSITNIERGTQIMQLSVLTKIADVLGMELIIRLEPKP